MNKTADRLLEDLRNIKIIRDEIQLFRDQNEVDKLRKTAEDYCNIKVVETSNNPDPTEYYLFPDESVFELENPRQLNYCCYAKSTNKGVIKKYLNYFE